MSKHVNTLQDLRSVLFARIAVTVGALSKDPSYKLSECTADLEKLQIDGKVAGRRIIITTHTHEAIREVKFRTNIIARNGTTEASHVISVSDLVYGDEGMPDAMFNQLAIDVPALVATQIGEVTK